MLRCNNIRNQLPRGVSSKHNVIYSIFFYILTWTAAITQNAAMAQQSNQGGTAAVQEHKYETMINFSEYSLIEATVLCIYYYYSLAAMGSARLPI